MMSGRRLPVTPVLVILTVLMLTGCANSPWRVEDRNREVVKEVVKAINAGRLDDLDALVASDYVRHSQATFDAEVNSRKELKEYLERERATFPDGKLAISFYTTEGDRVAFWGTFTGTQSGPMGNAGPTGRRVEVDVSGVHRLYGGKIVETWVTWDELAVLQELDMLPPVAEGDQGLE